jgi:N-acetylglucosaminyldiphosphoundecaprenol N-acetyl-beta-D-mannosaminyltransferase
MNLPHLDRCTDWLPSTRANVLGIGVHAVDIDAAVATIAHAITTRTRGYICAAGVHGVIEAQRDLALREIYSRALLVVPDGMPTVWMGRLQGLRDMLRVFGPDLMLAAFASPALHGCSHFLYGGNEGVAEQLQAMLRRRFPQARIVGRYTPPFRPLNDAESASLCETVAIAKPDITWIGLSTPKQERFMAEYLPRLQTTVMIGVGAAFDFHTGRLKDSPAWVKQMGLQWLHRLAQEPKRLGKRYLTNNPRFLVRAFLQLTGIRRFPLNGQPVGAHPVSRGAGPATGSHSQEPI